MQKKSWLITRMEYTGQADRIFAPYQASLKIPRLIYWKMILYFLWFSSKNRKIGYNNFL